MENISRIETNVREKTASPDILIISRTFLPKADQIGEYIYNRCQQEPGRVIVLVASCSGDKTFDKIQQFPVYRWQIPKYCYDSFIGNILCSLLNIILPFFLAIKLYCRYHYRYIEWGHGYDFLALLVLSYILPIRFFIYLHGRDIVLRNLILRSLFELTLQRSEGIVCNSSFTGDYLTANFRFHTPTHIIYPVVRREKFGGRLSSACIEDLRDRVRSGYHIPETAVVILSVGRLLKCKGFDLVIENLTPLLTLGIDVHYILCGQGPYESELKSLAERLRVGKRVHFAGYVPDRELASYYAACDMFAILASYSERRIEGFDIVYLEAGFFGKPVIASCLGGVMDAVRHLENGILVNPNSGLEMMQAFRWLCQDRKLREQLGCKGKALANRRIQNQWLRMRSQETGDRRQEMGA
ncbi:MAG: glycosyltransferase family 4 protein [Rhizonema sp. NSF051]|nr:glycosyltransferase family 4 protein [Rhizonema sp. NSF051]